MIRTNKIRYYILGALFILLLGVLCLFLCSCDKTTENERISPYKLEYKASDGGVLVEEGNLNEKKLIVEIVFHGNDAKKVMAIPIEGYYFVKWSDGVTEAARHDTEIKGKIDVTAEFAEITDGVSVTYKVEGDGYIRGNVEQVVQRGTDGWTVEAKLYGGIESGVVFIGWSDGLTEPIRQEKNVSCDVEFIAKFGYPVNYTTESNGRIVGEASQIIVFGEHSQTVTAVPDKGYRFVEWSDGVKTATRQDLWVSEPINVYAKFEWRDTDCFTYNYNYATGNYYEDGLTLTRGEVDGVAAIVPERDYFTFDGWYLDEGFNEKAIDSNGNNLLGEEIFNSPSRDLYAKWNVIEEYVTTYKILMVYVTAIDGTFIGNDGQNVEVHYKMSEKERAQYLELTKLFKDSLDDMLDGLVIFEVDNYFTATSVDEQSFRNEKKEICIYADSITELNESGILENYRSVITFFSFGAEENLLPSFAGEGKKKYATIPMDRKWCNLQTFDQVIEIGDLINTCVHEFIHTIEMGIACYDFHHSCNIYLPQEIEYKLYLLNQMPTDFAKLEELGFFNKDYYIEAWRNSAKGGIPYGWWTNELCEVIIKPECINGRPDGYGGVGTVDNGGYVYYYNSNLEELDWWRKDRSIAYGQLVPKGSRTTMFFPSPKKGYKFIGWSDGVKDELRVIYDVQENITLIAYFERQSYTIEYKASEGGRIQGEAIQTILTGERTKAVTAVADEGYRFVGWSDGWRDNNYSTRYDLMGMNEYDENGELYFRLGFTVTAIFEKIEE